MSEEADPLYRPLGGIEAWVAAPVDEAGWAEAVDRLHAAREAHPDWAAMVDRGMLLAAAHQSAALDGMHAADGDLVLSTLRGEASLGTLDETTRAHVRANHEALRLASDVKVSEHSIRRIHEVACRPQLTHPVLVDDRVQDHVLAAGDYKHHPNHIRQPTGSWRATAPVSQVYAEMAVLVEHVGSPLFADLHAAVQGAYLLHALDHVQPFADGNGRVARALAGGVLLRAAGIPFLQPAGDATVEDPPALVALVQRAGVSLVDVLISAGRDSPALDRWRAQEAAGDVVRRRLLTALADALLRYRRRPDRRADLSAAAVTAEDAVTVRVPLDGQRAVEEAIAVDAHPEDGDGPVVLRAREAGLRLEAGDGLDPWLDRVVSVLALRVAAELE